MKKLELQSKIELVFSKQEGFLQHQEKIHTYLLERLSEEKMIFEVAIMEAVNNAIMHGTEGTIGEKVYFEMSVCNGQRLVVRVRDEGPGFPVEEFLAQFSDSVEEYLVEQRFAESGRGIAMMLKTSDFIKYNSQGNEVLLICNFEEALDEEYGDEYW